MPLWHQAIIWINAGLHSIGPLEQTSMKFELKFIDFHWKRYTWKYHLQNGGHFVHEMEGLERKVLASKSKTDLMSLHVKYKGSNFRTFCDIWFRNWIVMYENINDMERIDRSEYWHSWELGKNVTNFLNEGCGRQRSLFHIIRLLLSWAVSA